MIAYPAELRSVAYYIEALQEFVDKTTAPAQGEGVSDEIAIDWDNMHPITLPVLDINGETIGYIGWTEHGSIGFMTYDETVEGYE